MTHTDSHYDAIVVGLGALGAATLYQLAQRGARVLGIDQHTPPHDLGSSHGESRITRLAVGEGDAFVPLVQRSHRIWRELEARTGRQLFSQTGGLILAPRDRIAAHHGKPDFLRRTIECAERFGIAHALLDAPAIRARFPQFALQGDELGYFEPEAGFVRPEEAIAAQLEAAVASGAVVRNGERVLAVEPLGNGDTVAVQTEAGRFTADQVVVAAGPWLPAFLGRQARADWQADFGVYRQVMYWFDTGAAAADFAPGRFPIFIWMFGDAQEDYMYGFPGADAARPVLKVATEQYAQTTTPETLERAVSTAEIEAMYRSRVEGRFPQIGGHAVKARACMYTVTPDRNFVVDALDGAPNVLIASACSGHGFKHSAGLGEAIAERVLGRGTRYDLGAFARQRPAPAA
ncbi:N-methyl-L-tryptophan oxidase [Variovorax arabinosiphilus]|uniref:N-methyl-L-tryptophan oxidase n=1 Tax=Variovorax arabinosiphilus TaxID=3053498 RepID=UPI00257793FB|nr:MULTISPECIES: N-methyl-L-tryptophan oxidase [unclassified Variovorax]MDM0119070.1 N-methyl-L-tryptophan oxidase [Variovorax sp. J2L1-78]MDM0129496.1 N-methyl-L-tryptophan oxidase [Variovorax sp. J2L1-63]MDM0232718.1 N-methyl-L-tryptophan oxidase [Variovorax sp. J2R1-6]